MAGTCRRAGVGGGSEEMAAMSHRLRYNSPSLALLLRPAVRENHSSAFVVFSRVHFDDLCCRNRDGQLRTDPELNFGPQKHMPSAISAR